MPRIYVALDLETTGLQADRDAIIEIGAVKFRGTEILGEWSSLINPGRPLPHKIARLTGIHPRQVERAPALAQVLPRLAHFIGDLPIVGHNIQFDRNFLQRAGLNVSAALDTFELARILMPYASRYTLGRLMDELGIRFVKRHRAVEDARAVSQLFVALLERAQQLDYRILEHMARLGDRAPEWSLRLAFQDLLRERARSAFAAGSIGAQLAAKNAATNDTLGLLFLRDRDEPPLKPQTHPQPLDVDTLAQLLEPEGLFAQQFPGYEFRAPQIEMLRAVARAFNDGATLLVEAGTGTGKSLAYLLPAIYWAVQNQHRVVISTNTINLQDQLFTKDIPDVRQVVPVEFRAALLKGRSNYLCRRRLEQMLQSRTLTVDQARVLAQVLAWLPSTTTGDNAELMLMGQTENAVWAQLASDPDHCAADQCEWREQGRCFFYHARAQAERAHILVVNHALLLSDLLTDHHVLPEFKYLIVDEAHHLEESATKAFAFEASRSSLDTLLRALAHERGGLLGMLAGATRNSAAPLNIKRETQRLLDDVAQDVERAARGAYDLYNALENFVTQAASPNENEGGYDRPVRLTPARRAQPDWNSVEIAWDAFALTLVKVRDGLGRIYKAWEDLGDWEVPSYFELAVELTGAMRRVEETRTQIEAIISKPGTNGIYWVTITKNNADVVLRSAPLYVGDLLQKQLFAEKNTTILTSATLCVDKRFAHLKARLGIGDWADELAVGAPFDFANAALLCVPTDIPEPGQPGYQKAVESFLVELLRATQGRALVLFTSISQLNATYHAITRPLEEDEIVVLAQNLDGSRRQVLETFKTQARTVLLGTRSFWEGVDVVGEALSCLVITRLPFSVPNDPIFAARSETFDDPFNQYAVPEAVLRFRQGFGRLIRSKTDRGVVVLLDRRILSKSYGRVFLESLPPVSKYQGTLQELPNVAAQWIAPTEQTSR